MQFALITHNFSLAYVSENNATFTPLLYSITGCVGPRGIVAALVAAALRINRARPALLPTTLR